MHSPSTFFSCFQKRPAGGAYAIVGLYLANLLLNASGNKQGHHGLVPRGVRLALVLAVAVTPVAMQTVVANPEVRDKIIP